MLNSSLEVGNLNGIRFEDFILKTENVDRFTMTGRLFGIAVILPLNGKFV